MFFFKSFIMTLVEISGAEIVHVGAWLRDERAKEACPGLQGREGPVGGPGGPCEGSGLWRLRGRGYEWTHMCGCRLFGWIPFQSPCADLRVVGWRSGSCSEFLEQSTTRIRRPEWPSTVTDVSNSHPRMRKVEAHWDLSLRLLLSSWNLFFLNFWPWGTKQWVGFLRKTSSKQVISERNKSWGNHRERKPERG